MVRQSPRALVLLAWAALAPFALAATPHPDDASVRRKVQDILSRREFENQPDAEDENVTEGRVVGREGRRLTVLDRNGETRTFEVREGADVTREGERTTVEQIRPGDEVKVITGEDNATVQKVEAKQPSRTGIPMWAAYLGVLVGVVMLAVLAGVVLARVRSVYGRDRRLVGPDDEQAAERRQRSRHYREEALARAQAGDYTEAVRYLFLSLVFLYDESGRVLYQRAYTNREYLSLFEDRPAVRRDLRVFVDLLDDRWYGQHGSTAEQYGECLNLYEQLSSQRG